MKKIKLVLADGNRLFVESLQQILEKEMDTAVISGANSGVDALRSCIEIQPDIAVVGEFLPDLSMVEAAKEIRRNVRNIRFVFMMRDGSADMLSLLSSMDSVGAVSQNCDIAEFLTALRSVARGERYISAGVIEHLKSASSDDDYNDDDPLNDITHREREVLYWVSHGLNNKEISERMYLSEKTIKNHVSNILRKLDLDDRTKAAAFAWEEGLPLLPEDFFTQLKMN